MCFFPICAWLVLTCCCVLGLERIEAEERYQRKLDAYLGRMVEQPVLVTAEYRPKKVSRAEHTEHIPVTDTEVAPEMKEGGE